MPSLKIVTLTGMSSA